MSLTTLPPELAGCVIANIKSQGTLCNLARCSRQLYLCTIPHLYYHVEILEETRNAEQHNRKLPTLASLLIRRPDLARLVRIFTLGVGCPPRVTADSSEKSVDFEESEDSEESEDFEHFEEPVSVKTVTVDQALKTAVVASSLSKEEENNWLEQLSHTHRCHSDSFLALLLPTLLMVERLEFDSNNGYCTCYLERMMQRAASREKPFDIQSPFKALKIITFSHEMSHAQRGMVFIASLLKLPAIQEISGVLGLPWNGYYGPPWEDLDDRVTIKNPMELNSCSSPLICLDLVAHAHSAADLGHMLRAPKDLKAFFYTICSPICVSFTSIRHALGPQQNCLRSIGFNYGAYYDPFSEGMANFQPMASFVSFKNLKYFKAAVTFLEVTENGSSPHKLVNMFPPSLETLHLSRFPEDVDAILEAVEYLLVQKSPQQIPLLKKLILEETDTSLDGPAKLTEILWKDTSERAIKRLTREGAHQGVHIDVIEHLPRWPDVEWIHLKIGP